MDDRAATQPVRHVILFRLYPDADPEEVLRRLRSLGDLPEPLAWRVERSLDERKGVVLMQDSLFASMSALQSFREAPEHVEVAAFLSRNADWLVADHLQEVSASADRGTRSGAPATTVAGVSDDGIRPWGHYEVLSDGEGFKTKTITVKPGKRLSYQKHAHRSEHWFVVKGSGTVVLDGETHPVAAGEAVDVPVGVAHRMCNTGEEDLVFVEVQTGTYFGEDDIIRLEDDFGRSA